MEATQEANTIVAPGAVLATCLLLALPLEDKTSVAK